MIKRMPAFLGPPDWYFAGSAEEDAVDVDVDVDVDNVIGQINRASITDLVVIAHGWNADTSRAIRSIDAFSRYFLDFARIHQDRNYQIVRVLWPCELFPDTPAPGEEQLSGQPYTGLGLMDRIFPVLTAVQCRALSRLTPLLDDPYIDDYRASTIRDLVVLMLEDHVDVREDRLERRLLLDPDWKTNVEELSYRHLQYSASSPLTDTCSRWRRGLYELLRVAVYSTYKERAADIGLRQLGPRVSQLGGAKPNLRIHLVGHGFGARLVSFATGDPTLWGSQPSRVSSLTLLQAMSSCYSFAGALPFSSICRGALSDVPSTIPTVVTYASSDLATAWLTGTANSTGELTEGEDYRTTWASLGQVGARSAHSVRMNIAKAGTVYTTAPGAILNVNCEGSCSA